MITPTTRNWVVGILIFLVLTTLAIYLWVEYQMTLRFGAYTQVVDRGRFQPQSGPMMITNVSLLAADGESMIPGQSILLQKGKIAAIGTQLTAPENTTLVDGSGKFLIPGLVDSHVHLEDSPNDLLLYLANGITHVRDMGGVTKYLTWRQQLRQDFVGPDIYITSEKVNSLSGIEAIFNSWTRTRINISSPAQANQLVEELKNEGFDAIKISSFINEDMYQHLLAAGKQKGIPAVGHLPYAIGLSGLWQSEQTELAHVEEITKALNEDFGGYNQSTATDYLKYVHMRSGEIATKLREQQIAVTSTIWLMETLPEQKFALPPLLEQLPLAYANPGIVEGTMLAKGWLPGHNSYQLSSATLADPDALARSRKFWQTYVAAIHIITRALAENDVQLMAGTDANTAAVVPGFSLHEELKSLTQSGLTNAQSLRSATATPGEWMQSNSGKILPGYDADLLLLDANPLADIDNTRAINAVFRAGRLFDRDKLDAMLAAVRQANDAARTKSITAFE